MDWEQEVRDALAARCEQTPLYLIAADCGISQGRLWDFSQGKSMSAANFAKVASFLGFSLRKPRSRKLSEIG